MIDVTFAVMVLVVVIGGSEGQELELEEDKLDDGVTVDE